MNDTHAFNREEALKAIEATLGSVAREGAERLSDTQLRDLLLNAGRAGKSLGVSSSRE